MRTRPADNRGFTLIELSIVLVIIGLIVGGVLVGQNLIQAASTRATIAQLEKFNTAVNTFRNKYSSLPGDMSVTQAQAFNFPPYDAVPCPGMPQFRCGSQGRGDGNGVLDAFTSSLVANPASMLGGETAMFWGDLSYASLIEGNFSADQTDSLPSDTTNVSSVLPAAKLGGNNYFIAYGNNSTNYFGLISVTSIASGQYTPGTPGLSVAQAYAIDIKIDDGFPQGGKVTAQYPIFIAGTNFYWAAGGGAQGTADSSATTGSATTCYDNNGVAGPQRYSTKQNGGTGLNCALAFQMQGAR